MAPRLVYLLVSERRGGGDGVVVWWCGGDWDGRMGGLGDGLRGEVVGMFLFYSIFPLFFYIR